MKVLLKRLGIIFVIVGVAILAVSEFSKLENNGLLILSAAFIVGGLITYLIINSLVE